MDNERPNERTLWSRRLEEPGALPGTGLTDKEAAWDKLYDRLKDRESPRRKRMIWLWTAAACLLLIIVPTALLLKDRHTPPAHGPIPVGISSTKQQSTQQDKLSARPPVAANPLQPGDSDKVDPDPRKELAHTRLAAESADPARQIPDLRQPTHPIAGQPAHPTMTRPDLNKLLTRDADTLTLVFAPRPDLSKPVKLIVAALTKKEVRVVHINEIEPAQPTAATVKGPRQKPGGLRFGLAPQETFRPSTTYVEPEEQSILSLKQHAQNP